MRACSSSIQFAMEIIMLFMSCRCKSPEHTFFVGHPVFQVGADSIGISRLKFRGRGSEVAYDDTSTSASTTINLSISACYGFKYDILL
jgi:hypothetical protein